MNQPRPQPRRRFPLMLAGLVLGCGLARAAGPGLSVVAADGEKTFVLFMGANFGVQQGGKEHRVHHVAGDSYVIAVDDRLVEVPMNRGQLDMKVTPELKLSGKTAQFNALTVERAYTPKNDPNRKWAAMQSGSAAQAAVGNAAGLMASAQLGAQRAQQGAGALAGPSGVDLGGGNAVNTTTANYQAAQSSAASDQHNAAYVAQQLQEELDQKLFDATVVTGEVSAATPVQDPYLVVVAHYREKGGSGATRSRIFAKALERLDERPLKVRLLQGDFPPGFELVRTRVHLYEAATELGTNVAEKNVWLTRDEAHEYLLVDHLSRHKGQSLPPGVALGVNAWEVQPHYNNEQTQQIIFVKVTKDGLPEGAFREADCHRRVSDPYLEQLLGRTRFKPALHSGKAVAGVAQLRIAELAP